MNRKDGKPFTTSGRASLTGRIICDGRFEHERAVYERVDARTLKLTGKKDAKSFRRSNCRIGYGKIRTVKLTASDSTGKKVKST